MAKQAKRQGAGSGGGSASKRGSETPAATYKDAARLATAARGTETTVSPGESPVRSQPTATVVFRVQTPPDHPEPYVVGSTLELGMWNPAAARALLPEGDNVYAAPVDMKPDHSVEFKYVWYDEHKELHWEVGENRKLKVEGGYQTADGPPLRT